MKMSEEIKISEEQAALFVFLKYKEKRENFDKYYRHFTDEKGVLKELTHEEIRFFPAYQDTVINYWKKHCRSKKYYYKYFIGEKNFTKEMKDKKITTRFFCAFLLSFLFSFFGSIFLPYNPWWIHLIYYPLAIGISIGLGFLISSPIYYRLALNKFDNTINKITYKEYRNNFGKSITYSASYYLKLFKINEKRCFKYYDQFLKDAGEYYKKYLAELNTYYEPIHNIIGDLPYESSEKLNNILLLLFEGKSLNYLMENYDKINLKNNEIFEEKNKEVLLHEIESELFTSDNPKIIQLKEAYCALNDFKYTTPMRKISLFRREYVNFAD